MTDLMLQTPQQHDPATRGSSPANEVTIRRVALIGNPNSGKTTLFNALTGLTQRTGNFPGITVERVSGKMARDVELIDLPGTYSLAPRSPDELIAVDLLLGRVPGEPRPDAVVVTVDATTLLRNLYLVTQVLELGLPTVVALNMADLADRAGVRIDPDELAGILGVPVVRTVATDVHTLGPLRDAIRHAAGGEIPAARAVCTWPQELQDAFAALAEHVDSPDFLIRRALIDCGMAAETDLRKRHGDAAGRRLDQIRTRLADNGVQPAALESRMRYDWINAHVAPRLEQPDHGPSFSDKVDAVVTHRIWGWPILLLVMGGLFVAVFTGAEPLMGWVEWLVATIRSGAEAALAWLGLSGGPLESLVTSGVIEGVGAVIIFVPQIALLFLLLALLEDCGYLARAAFVVDRVMRRFGLSGHSLVPMVSAFGCAVPGIMAARTIADRRDRLVTVLVAPLMSCTARIPVYLIMIAAFVPPVYVLGFLPLQGLVFAAMYFLGIVAAVLISMLLRRTILRGEESLFLMEMPSYKRPAWRAVAMRVWMACREFLLRAGTVIVVATILIWALSYFPRSPEVAERYGAERAEARAALQGPRLEQRLEELSQSEQGAMLRQSFLGRMGHTVEPVFRPLGWDWRISMAVIGSFPARELVVSILSITYDMGADVDPSDAEGGEALRKRLRTARRPDGSRLFTLPVALGIMVFFALCLQCVGTLVVIRRETRTWRWPIAAFLFHNGVAYVVALAVYQGAMALGLDKVT